MNESSDYQSFANSNPLKRFVLYVKEVVYEYGPEPWWEKQEPKLEQEERVRIRRRERPQEVLALLGSFGPEELAEMRSQIPSLAQNLEPAQWGWQDLGKLWVAAFNHLPHGVYADWSSELSDIDTTQYKECLSIGLFEHRLEVRRLMASGIPFSEWQASVLLPMLCCDYSADFSFATRHARTRALVYHFIRDDRPIFEFQTEIRKRYVLAVMEQTCRIRAPDDQTKYRRLFCDEYARSKGEEWPTLDDDHIQRLLQDLENMEDDFYHLIGDYVDCCIDEFDDLYRGPTNVEDYKPDCINLRERSLNLEFVGRITHRSFTSGKHMFICTWCGCARGDKMYCEDCGVEYVYSIEEELEHWGGD